jgi:alkylation response protein AidB-like acyl-CoA dehydrogenase
MISFTLDEDQRQIQDMTRKFAAEELRKIARDCDEKGAVPEELLAKSWELGLVTNAVPEKYGGYAFARSIVTGAIMAEELAYGDLSLALAITSPALFVMPLMEMGTEEQKDKYLPAFCKGSFQAATLALMEPRVQFSVGDLRTTAVDDGDKFLVNGEKCCVPLADKAEWILVLAASNKGAGPAGVDAFIVPKGTRGMKVGEREWYMGIRPLPVFPLSFADCEVPKENRLGGTRGINYMRLINLSRIILSAMAVGVSRASLDYCITYAKERYAFGEPIASRQAIAFMLAEMAMETDGMRILNWKAAWKADRGEDCTKEAYLSRSYAAAQTMKITDYGVQVLGGHGYIREHPVEMWLRNGRGFATLEGLAMA